MLRRITYILVFLMAAGEMASAFFGSVIALPIALIPLTAGIGIVRKRVWSAYGFAVFLLSQLVVAFLLIARKPGAASDLPTLVAGIVLGLLLSALLFAAGRSMGKDGAPRGHATPWIVLAALATLPAFFIQAFVIPTGSMEDTLLIGDRVIVQRFPRPKVARGELIVLASPQIGPRRPSSAW
jgi:hypothetical protein